MPREKSFAQDQRAEIRIWVDLTAELRSTELQGSLQVITRSRDYNVLINTETSQINPFTLVVFLACCWVAEDRSQGLTGARQALCHYAVPQQCLKRE